MKMPILRSILYVGISILLVAVGFCFGSYYSGKRTVYVSDACTVMWLTGIDKALDKQDLAEARKRTDFAIDANVGVLSSLKSHPYMNFIALNSPWIIANEIAVSNTLLANTNKYYLGHEDRIRPETHNYLEQIR